MEPLDEPITDNTLDIRIKQALETPEPQWRTAKGIAEKAQVPVAIVNDFLARNIEHFDQTLVAGVPMYAVPTGERRWIVSSTTGQRPKPH